VLLPPIAVQAIAGTPEANVEDHVNVRSALCPDVHVVGCVMRRRWWRVNGEDAVAGTAATGGRDKSGPYGDGRTDDGW